MNCVMPNHKKHSTVRGFPLRIFTAAFVISMLAAALNGWQEWQMHERFEDMSRRHIAIRDSVGRIMLFDEALTMSASMAAATGDFSYEKRYDQFDPQLTAEINALRAMLPQSEIERFVEETDKANLALVKMERQAFELTHLGRRQEALALLTGDEYVRLKNIYAGGMEKTIKAADEQIKNEDQELHSRSLGLAATHVVSVMVLLAAWFFAARAARHWVSERNESEDALRKARDELEVRVEQRTADLSNRNEELYREISEREKAQKELKRNQDLLNEAQLLGKLGNWELNLLSGELRWSDEIFRIFELDPENFLPSYEKFLNAIHPEDRDKVNQAYTQSLEDRKPYDITHRLLLADGSLKWVHEHCINYFNAAGQPVRYIGTVQDITAQKQAEEQIRDMAFYDTLTHLPNRRLLNDRLEQTIAVSKRSGRHGALMFLDLDNFKSLNDTHGHAAGDLLLIEAARRISNSVRKMDTVARFGGDEFVVLISELDVDKTASVAEAGSVAEKIRTALAKPYVLTIQHEGKAKITIEHQCTSSIGVSLLISQEASAEDILKWTDKAMYKAKADGGNLIRFFDS